MNGNGWRRAKLVDLAAKKRWALNGGPFGSKLTSRNYVDAGVPVIRGTNLSGGGKFSFDNFVFVSEPYADELQANNAHPGDLIFTQRGTIGQVGLIPESSPYQRFVISQSQMKLTPDEQQVDRRFLYYYFTSPDTVKAIENLAFSAGVPHINLDILRGFEIDLPPLPIQRRIASILSSYDDLIENNQRRIKILEEMARLLYREWFVNFRFPGHEKVRMVDSPLGKIPEGWEVLPFSALASYVNGFAFKPEHLGSEGQPIIKIKELKAGVTADTPRNPGNGIPEKYAVRNGDLLFSWSADLDAYLWMDGDGWLNQHLFNVLPSEGFTRTFCYHALKTWMPRFRGMSLGATMHHIKRSALDQVFTVAPPRSLMDKFDGLVDPMHSLQVKIRGSILNLRRTRDLLLPRLLSGQLEVEAEE